MFDHEIMDLWWVILPHTAGIHEGLHIRTGHRTSLVLRAIWDVSRNFCFLHVPAVCLSRKEEKRVQTGRGTGTSGFRGSSQEVSLGNNRCYCG